MPCGGAPYGDSNLVFVANDWHTALLPVYLQVGASGAKCVAVWDVKRLVVCPAMTTARLARASSHTFRPCLQAHYRDYDKMTYARSVAVIHNMAHQGRGPMAELAPLEIPQQYEDLVSVGTEHRVMPQSRGSRCTTLVRRPHGLHTASVSVLLLPCSFTWTTPLAART